MPSKNDKSEGPIQFEKNVFAEEDAKLQELKKSTNILDQLTVALMEPHPGEPFTSQNDCVGIYYAYARAKAAYILEQFAVTPKDQGSPLPEGPL